MRISRALALAGIDSRRKCETYVRNGAITVNGEVVRNLATQVDPQKDVLTYRGRVLHFDLPLYYMVFKPEGYVTTASDPYGAKTVFRLLPKSMVTKTKRPGAQKKRVFPVGRLDKDSSGLLLFTSDGALANHLMHPRYGVGKWYEVRIHRVLEPKDKQSLLKGVRLSDGLARAQRVERVTKRVYRVLMKEGRNRIVRRMFGKLDYRVQSLCRISFGPLKLSGISPGKGRFLTKTEIIALQKVASSDKMHS